MTYMLIIKPTSHAQNIAEQPINNAGSSNEILYKVNSA